MSRFIGNAHSAFATPGGASAEVAAAAMGGRVWLETVDGPGATFAFALPAELVSGPV